MVDRDKVINELVDCIESALSVDSDYIDCVRTDLLETVVGMLKDDEMKWTEIRNTIRELRDNNPDKPDVQNVMHYLLELMKVIWEK